MCACFDLGYVLSDISDDERTAYSAVILVAPVSATDVWRGVKYC